MSSFEQIYQAERVDVGSNPLEALVLRREGSTDSVLTGYFVDYLGRQISTTTYSATISSTPLTLATALGLTSLPVGAVGFVGRLTLANLIFALSALHDNTIPAATTTDMGSNPTYYPVLSTSTYFVLGKV